MEPDATNLSPAAESCGQAGKEAGRQGSRQAALGGGSAAPSAPVPRCRGG